MSRVVEGGFRPPFQDLHVDQVDPGWKPRAAWLEGALRCLEQARDIRDERRWDVTVAAGFSLTANPAPAGITFASLARMSDEIDWSPPSLYLFEPGSEPWRPEDGCTGLDPQYVQPPAVRGYFCEWYHEHDAEYRRSLWLVV